jgi:prepilin-type processing-associated H-X9-DG protein
MDRMPLYTSLNFAVQTHPINDGRLCPFPANETVFTATIASFLCPSYAPATPTSHGCNYRGNYGVGPSPSTTSETRDSGNGFYTLFAVLGPQSFPDGLAHTVAYSERIRGTGQGPGSATRDFGEIRVLRFCTIRDADYALDCARLASIRDFPAYQRGGFTWFLGDFECTAYCHAQEPNGRIPDAITRNEWAGIVTARSVHSGGVNCLMGDGSVRFIGDEITRKTWRSLGTRNGDELVE